MTRFAFGYRRATGGWQPLFGGSVEEPPPPPPPPPTGDPYAPTILGRKPTNATTQAITGQDLSGASGGVDSRLHADTWWTHADRGEYLYALGYDGVGGPDGHVVVKKVHRLSGVELGDATNYTGGGQWEDSAFDVLHGSRWWVANCGDNNNTQGSFKAFRFSELASLSNPSVIATVAADTFWFHYPGTQAWDCETMLCDPLTGQVFFVTKEAIGTAQVWAAPRTLVQRTSGGTQSNALQAITSGNFTRYNNLTGGDISPDGTTLLVRNNTDKGSRYTVVRGGDGFITGFTWVENFTMPLLMTTNNTAVTAETLFYRADGNSFIINSEGGGSQIAELIAP
jgi:hypothetical protein